MKKGFTLIELLVVIALLAIAGTFILSIFTQSLKGSNKSEIVSSIKQSGQSVLDNMAKQIRNADNVVCVSPKSYTLAGGNHPVAGVGTNPTCPAYPSVSQINTLVIVKNGVYTRFSIIPPVRDSNLNICGNGFIVSDSPPAPAANQGSIDTLCTPAYPTTNEITLTNTDSQTGISINCNPQGADCSSPTYAVFKENPSPGFKDQVLINFTATPGINSPFSKPGQIDPIPFETTVQLR